MQKTRAALIAASIALVPLQRAEPQEARPPAVAQSAARDVAAKLSADGRTASYSFTAVKDNKLRVLKVSDSAGNEYTEVFDMGADAFIVRVNDQVFGLDCNSVIKEGHKIEISVIYSPEDGGVLLKITDKTLDKSAAFPVPTDSPVKFNQPASEIIIKPPDSDTTSTTMRSGAELAA